MAHTQWVGSNRLVSTEIFCNTKMPFSGPSPAVDVQTGPSNCRRQCLLFHQRFDNVARSTQSPIRQKHSFNSNSSQYESQLHSFK